jgi:hypothetical protein
MAIVFMMNEEIARGMVCFFHQKKHSYLIFKNPNLGKIWRALEWKMLVYFKTIWKIFNAIWYNILPFGIVCGHLVYFSHFGMFGPSIIWQPCIWSRMLVRTYSEEKVQIDEKMQEKRIVTKMQKSRK